MIGTTIGRYRIVAKLGEGGMGSVWRAEDPVLGRTVALKILSPALLGSEEARQRFLREARAASRLKHPSIATVFDAGESDGAAWIAFELVEGESLEHVAAKGALSMPELFALARGTAAALAHAHEKGVLHRDLTASNVMLRPDGTPVIVDFGLARGKTDATLTSTGTTLGTASYMAPEMWRGKAGSESSDLWSLGVVLYRAATGALPFAGASAESVMYNVLNTEPQPPIKLRPELPDAFSRQITRLLEKDPGDRPESAAEVTAALAVVTSPQPVTETPSPPRQSIRTGFRRWRHRVGRVRFGPAQGVALVIVTAAVLAGAWLGYQRLVAAKVRVLAVIPLRNASRDTVETAFVGEGLGQELVRRLGAVGGFRILPWTTTAALPIRGRKPELLAHELGADVLLFGSHSDDGKQLQALVELVDGHSGLQLWSERYTRASSDLIGLQTDLATSVAVRVGHAPRSDLAERIARSTPANAEAYDLYVRGASYWHSSDATTQGLVEPLFTRAVALDPTLAVAWVGLGGLHVDNYMSGQGYQNLVEADSCFRHALDLDPQLPEALRGRISLASEIGDTDECLRLAGEALQKHPKDPDALITAGWGFHLGGLPELAVPALDRALELNPNDPGGNWYHAFALSWSGDDRRCLEAGRAYIRRFGEDAPVYYWLGMASAALHRPHEAQTSFERLYELQTIRPLGPGFLAGWYNDAGDSIRMRSLLDSTIVSTEMLVSTSVDNVRLRGELAVQLALRRLTARRNAEVAVIAKSVRQGQLVTGTAVVCIPFAAAAAGDLAGAQRISAELPVSERTWAGWWVQASFASRGGYLAGGRTPDFLRSAEFRAIRRQIDDYHSKRMAIYQPILEQALRR